MKKILATFYMSTTLSHSNDPSNLRKYFSKSTSFSINSTKLKGGLHPFIGLNGQFLLRKFLNF
jgi:hypothetical protein